MTTDPATSAPHIVAPSGWLGTAANGGIRGMVVRRVAVLGARCALGMLAHLFRGDCEVDAPPGRRWFGGAARRCGGRVAAEPALVLTLAGLGAQAPADLGPGFGPPSGAANRPQGDQRVEVVRSPHMPLPLSRACTLSLPTLSPPRCRWAVGQPLPNTSTRKRTETLTGLSARPPDHSGRQPSVRPLTARRTARWYTPPANGSWGGGRAVSRGKPTWRSPVVPALGGCRSAGSAGRCSSASGWR